MTEDIDTTHHLRQMLVRSIALPVVLMAMVGVTLYWQVNQLLELNRWVDHSDRVIADVNRVERMLVDRETGVRGFASTNEEVFLQPFSEAEEHLDEAFDELATAVRDQPDQLRRVRRVRDLAGRWRQEFAADLLAATRAQRPIALADRLRGKGLMDEMRATLTAFARFESTLRERRSRDVQGAVRQGTALTGGFVLAVALVMAFFTRRQILAVTASYDRSLALSRDRAEELARSERALVAAIDAYGGFITSLARGDLTAAVEPTGDAELQQLGRHLGAMGTSLRTTTVRVNEAVAALVSAATEILATTQQQAASAAETASAVTETVSVVDEVTQTSQQTAERASAVSSTARRSLEVSASGREAVAHTVGAMDRVRLQVGAIAERILALSDQAQAVSQIVASVNELAEQSNLLALNAAIEAARAGDQGRGFAVVAQEVRSLAEQSKRATAQIRSILNDIQRSTSAAVLATEEGGKAVTSAVDTVRVAGERIDQLAGTIADASQAAQHIVTATQQQVTGIGQIAQAMRAIDQASTQALDGTRQSERAARELNDLAARLRDAVAQYRA